MRFSLRTLLIIMLLAGPLGAFLWKEWRKHQEELAQAEATRAAAQQQRLQTAQYNAWIRAAWTAQNQPLHAQIHAVWNEQEPQPSKSVSPGEIGELLKVLQSDSEVPVRE